MSISSPGSIVRAFVESINVGDTEAVASLISDKVRFIDIHGRVYQEEAFMADYMSNFPDYRIVARHLLQSRQGAAIVGTTAGSHVPPEIEERETLVWTAEVRDGLITEWRIYAGDDYAERS